MMNQKKPMLVCIGGLPATGKSTLARGLQPYLGSDAILIDPDRTMLRLLGKPEGSVLRSEDLNPALIKSAIAAMKTETREALANRHPVIVASAFVGAQMRAEFETIAEETNADLRTFWLEAPVPVLHERARQRERDSRDVKAAFNNASAVGVDHIKLSLIEGDVSWPIIDANQSPAKMLQDLTAKLGGARRRAKAHTTTAH